MSGKWWPEASVKRNRKKKFQSLIESDWLNGVVSGIYNGKLFIYIFEHEITATLFANHLDASIFKVEDLVAVKIQRQAYTRPEFSSNHKVLQIRPIPYTPTDILKITSSSQKQTIFIVGNFLIEDDDYIFNDFLGRAYDPDKLLERFKNKLIVNTPVTLSVIPKSDPNKKTRSFLHIVDLIEQEIYQKPKENSQIEWNNCLGLIRHQDPKYYFIWTKGAPQDLKLCKNEYTDYRNGVGKWIRFRGYSHQGGDFFVCSPVETVVSPYKTKERDGFVQIEVECLGFKMDKNGVQILETNSVGEVADILNVLEGKETFPFYFWIEPNYDRKYHWRLSREANLSNLEINYQLQSLQMEPSFSTRPSSSSSTRSFQSILSPSRQPREPPVEPSRPRFKPLGFDAPTHLANQENTHRHEANGNKLPLSSFNGAPRKTRKDYAKLSCADFCKELYFSEGFREAFKKTNPELYEAFVEKVHSLP